MHRLVAFLLLFSLTSFSNNNIESVQLQKISFEEFKYEHNFQLQLSSVFIKPQKRSLLPSGPLSDLINKFAKTNYLSVKIKSSKERVNELKISFSKSSLAIKYILD